MAVDAKHPEYSKQTANWQKCRDVFAGEEVIKDAGELYLPMLEGQDNMMYDAYKMRASFFNATQRTVEALNGMIFRKAPEIQIPETAKKELDHIAADGSSIELLASKVSVELFISGRFGLLVDAPDFGDEALTKGVNPTPYIAWYRAEDILNWRIRITNKEELTKLVLQEVVYEEDEEDRNQLKEVKQLRVLELDNEGLYIVTLWRLRKVKNKEEWVHSGEFAPTARGRRLNHIPFVFANMRDLSSKVYKPPILDLCNVNLSHYRSVADLEHGAHFTALPTAYLAGFDVKQHFKIGSQIAWVSEDANAKAGYLEYKGQGLGALEKRVEAKEKQMAILGTRLLETDKAGAEKPEALRIRKASETNTVSTVAIMVSSAMTEALKLWYNWLQGKPDRKNDVDMHIELNKDYIDLVIDPQMLLGLMQAVQKGLISYSTFFFNLKRGEVVPDARTEEEEIEMIDQGTPSPIAQQGTNNPFEQNAGDNTEEDNDEEDNTDE